MELCSGGEFFEKEMNQFKFLYREQTAYNGDLQAKLLMHQSEIVETKTVLQKTVILKEDLQGKNQIMKTEMNEAKSKVDHLEDDIKFKNQ